MRRNRDVTDTDEEGRVARDGDTLRFPMALMDHQPIKGESKMTTATVTVNDKAMSAEDVVRALEAKDAEIAALKAQIPVADAAIAARDAARLRARDSLLAQQAAKHNAETAHGAYVSGIRDSWKSGQSWR